MKRTPLRRRAKLRARKQLQRRAPLQRTPRWRPPNLSVPPSPDATASCAGQIGGSTQRT